MVAMMPLIWNWTLLYWSMEEALTTSSLSCMAPLLGEHGGKRNRILLQVGKGPKQSREDVCPFPPYLPQLPHWPL